MSERFKPRELYRAQATGQIPRDRPAFSVHHRSPAEIVADAARQKRAASMMTCRKHGRPWTDCTECSPARKVP